MNMHVRQSPFVAPALAGALAILILGSASADTLEMADGTVKRGVYVRDEGIRYLVWDSLAAVGGTATAVPRSHVKAHKVERDAAWDAHPIKPDLSVTFIELTPKLAGLHGRVDYDPLGRPSLRGGSLQDLGDRAFLEPETITKGLKLKYAPGEPVTLTAHVKNVGFAPARGFAWTWLIDGKPAARGRHRGTLDEMAEATFPLRWRWQQGMHHVTFRVTPGEPEIASINNEVTDPLWGWGFTYVVHKGRVAAWHQHRTAYGTFSFEDFYRWHIEIMNTLFAASRFPSAPEGIKARVRLDRIVYADDVDAVVRSLVSPDGIRYDQGGWVWLDDQDRKRKWEPPTKEWRNQTEWSLPHELGHQLGLTDLYALDYAGDDAHKWPDTGEKITHFMTHPMTMMHWHGPHLWSELDAGYLNMTWDKPRGHFGDYYFALPRECWLRIVDVNGHGVPEATVEVFQRGVERVKGEGVQQHGAIYYPVAEDGNFDRPVSKEPVITGRTGPDGLFRLPNRPAAEVRTLSGFHRQDNPFGNINVVGNRGLMLARVTHVGRSAWFWLEVFPFNVAWFRGDRERFTMTLKTPFAAADAPLAPLRVEVSRVDEHRVRVSWAPTTPQEQHYLERPIGWRVYRRVGSDGLNDRPWFPVATLPVDAREFTVDLRQAPTDIHWFSQTNRLAVTAVGDLGVESALTEAILPAK